MASPPVISAPMLVTSTNPSTQNSEDFEFKYMEAKSNCRKLKAQMREQAKKSRQLIVVVKNKLQEEEKDKIKVN